MGCITDAMRIMSVLNHGVLNYLRFSSITCPILPESLARFHQSPKVMSCEQFPPHPAVYKANWACQNQNNYEATS